MVGGGSDASGLGASWLYVRVGSTWIQQGYKLSIAGGTGQGHSVAISDDGSTVSIGAPQVSASVGAAFAGIIAGACMSCPAGYYCPANGGLFVCPGGSSCPYGSGSPSLCLAGSFSLPSAASCSTCSPGFTSISNSTSCFCGAGNYSLLAASQLGSKLVPDDPTAQPAFGSSGALALSSNGSVLAVEVSMITATRALDGYSADSVALGFSRVQSGWIMVRAMDAQRTTDTQLQCRRAATLWLLVFCFSAQAVTRWCLRKIHRRSGMCRIVVCKAVMQLPARIRAGRKRSPQMATLWPWVHMMIILTSEPQWCTRVRAPLGHSKGQNSSQPITLAPLTKAQLSRSPRTATHLLSEVWVTIQTPVRFGSGHVRAQLGPYREASWWVRAPLAPFLIRACLLRSRQMETQWPSVERPTMVMQEPYGCGYARA